MRPVLIGLALFASAAHAHDAYSTKLTWTRDISRIINNRCLSCHSTEPRPSGSGPITPPISLATYEEARPWAKAIKEEVLDRRMPPWGAVKGFGDFSNDMALTQEEISLIADWVEGGAPEGDPNYLPAKVPAPNTPTPPRGPETTVYGALALKAPLLLAAIRPKSVSAPSVRFTAEFPDGSIEPLLWLRGYNPKFPHTYALRTPMRLPPGTKIQISPPDGAVVTLIAVSASKQSVSGH